MFLVLSKTSLTPALFDRPVSVEPFQIKSSPRLPRIDFMDCSPKQNRKASATFDLPLPFGPTMAVTLDLKSSSVFLAKLLKPDNSNDLSMKLFYHTLLSNENFIFIPTLFL